MKFSLSLTPLLPSLFISHYHIPFWEEFFLPQIILRAAFITLFLSQACRNFPLSFIAAGV